MKKKKHLSQVLSAFLAFLVLTCAILPSRTYGETKGTDQFTVSEKINYINMLRAGDHYPAVFRLENNGGDFEGTVSYIVPGPSESTVAYEQPLSIAAGGIKELTFDCLCMTTATTAVLEIKNGKGKTVQTKKYDNLLSQVNDDTFIVGLISDDPTTLNRLVTGSVYNHQSIRPICHTMTAEEIPTKGNNLDIYDVIIISDYSTDRLSTAQKNAILEWTEKGGMLVFGTGESYSKVFSGFQNLPNLKLGDMTKVRSDFGAALTLSQNTTPVMDQSDFAHLSDDEIADTISGMISWGEIYAEGFGKASYEDRRSILEKHYGQLVTDACWYSAFGISSADARKSFDPDTYRKNASYLEYTVDYIFDMIINNAPAESELSPEDYDFISVKHEMKLYTASILPVSFGDCDPEATDSITGKSFAVSSSADYGKGGIYIVAGDFVKEPFFTIASEIGLLPYLVSNWYYTRFGMRRLQQRGQYYMPLLSSYDRDLVEKLSSGFILPLYAYIIIFVAYAAMSFVLWFILKKRNKSIWLWPGEAGLAVIATCLVILLSLSTRITSPTCNTVVFKKLEDGQLKEQTELTSLIIPKNSTYDINFNKSYSGEPLVFSSDYRYYTAPSFQPESPDMIFHTADSQKTVSIAGKTVMSSRYLGGKTQYVKQGEKLLSFNAKYENGKLRGTVTNHSSFNLENAAVLIDYAVFVIGDLDAGKTLDLSTLNATPLIRRDSLIITTNGIDTEVAYNGFSDAILNPNDNDKAINVLGFSKKHFKEYYDKQTALNSLSDVVSSSLMGIHSHSAYDWIYIHNYGNPIYINTDTININTEFLTREDYIDSQGQLTELGALVIKTQYAPDWQLYYGINDDLLPFYLENPPIFVALNCNSDYTALAPGERVDESVLEVWYMEATEE